MPTAATGSRSGPAAGTSTVTADRVVLALPFSILRNVDYAKAGFSPVKKTAIEELGMGTNSKLHVQFDRRHWNSLGNQGDTYADTGYQTTWEVTRAQPGTAGILVDYTGGKIGASFGSGTPGERATQFLNQIEPVLPGISRAGTAGRPSTTGPDTSGPRAPTPTGRSASTRSSPAPSAKSRTAATSPASTPRSTSRATSTAPSSRANGPPARSSRR